MTLFELIKDKIGFSWPTGADFVYQSAIDKEIYFMTGCRVVKRMQAGALCDQRGIKNRLMAKHYIEMLAPPSKEVQRDRMIQRIENHLRKDFDIDSPAFAVEMFNKGWRV